MRYTSPLRYPGGKGKLADFIALIFRLNGLTDGDYVEPYAGGAAVAFHLLFEGIAKHVHINDINAAVYAFWDSVLNDTDNLCKLIFDTPVTIDIWQKQKTLQSRPTDISRLELGFSTFFLNRTNRSGIIRGGVIGGKSQNGQWLLDARYNKEGLIERIERIARRRDEISLYNEDACTFLTDIVSELPKLSLVYLDPPYYNKSNYLYQNFYSHEDHATVATVVTEKLDKKWMVSYDNTAEVRGFYKGYRELSYTLNYSAAERYKGSELMYFSHDLIVPAVKNPAKVKLKEDSIPLL